MGHKKKIQKPQFEEKSTTAKICSKTDKDIKWKADMQ